MYIIGMVIALAAGIGYAAIVKSDRAMKAEKTNL